ncbi:MAG TPA: ATP-binding protein, partial [Armatimonadota bacterium]|nr:ATP-binding protein [Armatimonadota bacterium]
MRVLLAKLAFCGCEVSSGAFLVFAIAFAGRRSLLRRPSILALLGVHAISIPLALLLGWSRLTTGDVAAVAADPVALPAGWRPAHGTATLASTLVASGLFAVMAIQVPAHYRSRVRWMAVAALLPLAASMAYAAHAGHEPAIRLIPAGHAASGLLMVLAFHGLGLLDALPLARDLVFMRMPDPVLVMDRRDRIADMNHGAEALLGVPVRRAVGLRAADVASRFPELAALLASPRAGAGELAVSEPDGARHFAAKVSSVGADEREATGTVVLLHDITDRKEAELALRAAHEELQALEQMRDDLTHMIVHDLRTPLTSVASGLRTLRTVARLDSQEQALLDTAIEGGDTLLSMINDLLDISKMEAGALQLRLQEVAPEELIRQACQQVELLARQKGQTLVAEPESGLPSVYADPDLARRTLVNLLGNAVKFTPSGGAVTVTASVAEGEAVVFRVSDTGIGIPEDARERIFDKFGQIESRKTGGRSSTGLGLTLCRLAVEAHGGRIWVDSEPGAGSTFSFALGGGVQSG